jgi:ribosomal protein L37AE/L43A
MIIMVLGMVFKVRGLCYMEKEQRCPVCGNKTDKCPSGHFLCYECGWQTEGCDWPSFKETVSKTKNNYFQVI